MHYAFEIVRKIVSGDVLGPRFRKIAPVCGIDVVPMNGHVLVSVRPGLFVKQPDHVKQFVFYDPSVGIAFRWLGKKKKKV